MALPLLAAVPAFMPIISKVLDLFPDGDARAKAEAEYQRALLDAATKEAADNREINRTEAMHQSIFVSGWRPFIGWGCGICVLYGYMLQPLLAWFLAVYFPESSLPLPQFPMEYVWELMFGMLGIGGLRTVEKLKGKAR